MPYTRGVLQLTATCPTYTKAGRTAMAVVSVSCVNAHAYCMAGSRVNTSSVCICVRLVCICISLWIQIVLEPFGPFTGKPPFNVNLLTALVVDSVV